jgi:hypothetical protein
MRAACPEDYLWSSNHEFVKLEAADLSFLLDNLADAANEAGVIPRSPGTKSRNVKEQTFTHRSPLYRNDGTHKRGHQRIEHCRVLEKVRCC